MASYDQPGALASPRGVKYNELEPTEGDYVALTAFDREYVESQLARCAQFLDLDFGQNRRG